MIAKTADKTNEYRQKFKVEYLSSTKALTKLITSPARPTTEVQ